MVWSKYLSSWTGPDMSKSQLFRSGHVQITIFQIWTCPDHDFSGPDMSKSRLLVEFSMFWIQFLGFEEISRWFCTALPGEAEKHVFWASPGKAMQNHLEISSKIQFWTRNVRNWTKSRHLGYPSDRVSPPRFPPLLQSIENTEFGRTNLTSLKRYSEAYHPQTVPRCQSAISSEYVWNTCDQTGNKD